MNLAISVIIIFAILSNILKGENTKVEIENIMRELKYRKNENTEWKCSYPDYKSYDCCGHVRIKELISLCEYF